MPINMRYHEPLTKRQLEILRGLAEGKNYRDIGRSMTEPSTSNAVKGQVKALYSKLGADNAPHAVSLGYRAGILGDPGVGRWWLNIREWNADAEYIVCRQCRRELGYPESDVHLQDDGQVWCSFCGQTWWPTWISRVR